MTEFFLTTQSDLLNRTNRGQCMKRDDDFKNEIKKLLAHRVGLRCSNPNCRQPTVGPSAAKDKSVNVGVAAHITAASIGGPRYDGKLSNEERKGPDNGIWLCQNHAKLIDNDPQLYTVGLLRDWRKLSEEAARCAIENSSSDVAQHISDPDLIRFFGQCLDRPAFQDPFAQEGSMLFFDKALEDTITAINTGCLRARDGHTLAQAKGKAYLQNNDWRRRMDIIVDLLRAIRDRYELGVRLKQIVSNESWHCVNDADTADWMDLTRLEVLKIFAELAEEAGVSIPRISLQSRKFSGRLHP